MTHRPNDFPRSVRIAARRRATRDGVVYCEGEDCGLPIKRWRIDHIKAASMGGSNKLDNAQCLGPCCWPVKDGADNLIAKTVSRIAASNLGVRPHKVKIQSRGFVKVDRPSRCGPTSKTLPRRTPGG